MHDINIYLELRCIQEPFLKKMSNIPIAIKMYNKLPQNLKCLDTLARLKLDLQCFVNDPRILIYV